MKTGRERVEALAQQFADWMRSGLPEAIAKVPPLESAGDAIAADLDKLERIREAAAKVSITKSIHGPDVFLGFEELLAAIGGHSDRT